MINLTYILCTKHKPSSYMAKRLYNCNELTSFKIKKIASPYSYGYKEAGTLEGIFKFPKIKGNKFITQYEIYVNFEVCKGYNENHKYFLKHIRRLIENTKIKSGVIQKLNFINKILND